MKIKNKSGFSFVEMIVVLVILGVGITIFYATLGGNWRIMNNFISRADLWQEMDVVIDRATIEGRDSNDITVTTAAGASTITFLKLDGRPPVTISMDNTGQLSINTEGGPVVVLSTNVDFANSSFVELGRSIVLNLTLMETLMDGNVSIDTSTEIYPRN